ncbi:hypothetical protein SAMN06297144_0035 [Sphingomonas guangdongensis]|uniref:DUF6440 domain-containing protein n=1 Tax=Sphingomonas guangdongensis TaxID=1141890 RepID=A0A285Q9B7_9SPHN|nr:DUF6440 family protein [Sphingomonas guangdongensis]SOB78530.1 hypothetical protein SAMN06297144_0035 [Sphingomonas guangdongensis]
MTRTGLIGGLVAATLLGGCGGVSNTFQSAPITTDTVEGKIRGTRNGGEQVRVWRDPDTGCQYLLWERRRQGGITPRLTPEGRPICRG